MTRDQATRDFLARLEARDRQPTVATTRTQPAYRAARVDRFNKSWQPEHFSADAAVYDSWDLTTRRTRDMVRNDPVFRKARAKLIELVIGAGLVTFSAAVDDDFQEIDAFNDEADHVWEHWCEHEADAEGKLTWWDMEQIAFGENPEVGNTLLLRCQNNAPGRRIPLCYQLLEWEQLDRSRDRPATDSSNKIVNGIELDRFNHPVGYWIFEAHPYDQHANLSGSTRSTWVPAERVIHNYAVSRPSATCGISWFSAIVQPTRDMDWYLGNELTAAAIGALLTLVVHKKNYSGGGVSGLVDGDDDVDEYGNEGVKLGRGVVATVGHEDKVEVAESSRPNRNADPFIRLLLQFQSMGLNLSYHRLTGDTQRSSYTAIRASHLDDASMVRPLQQFFGCQVSLRVRREHTRQVAALGRYKRMTARYLQDHPWEVLQYDVIGPGREQLDPEKETDAALKRIRGGISTLKIECALKGHHWRRILLQKAKELNFAQELEEKYSLQTPLLDFTTNERGGSLPQAMPVDDDEEGDDDA